MPSFSNKMSDDIYRRYVELNDKYENLKTKHTITSEKLQKLQNNDMHLKDGSLVYLHLEDGNIEMLCVTNCQTEWEREKFIEHINDITEKSFELSKLPGRIEIGTYDVKWLFEVPFSDSFEHYDCETTTLDATPEGGITWNWGGKR